MNENSQSFKSSKTVVFNLLTEECLECESKIGKSYIIQEQICENCPQNILFCENEYLLMKENTLIKISNKINQTYQSKYYVKYCQNICECTFFQIYSDCLQCYHDCLKIYFKSIRTNNIPIKNGQISRVLNSCNGCVNCSNSNQICTQCSGMFFLDNNQCLRCDPNCWQCTGLQQCIDCFGGYYLKNGICINCPSNCIFCNSFNQCQVCNQPYKIQEISGQCVLCDQPGEFVWSYYYCSCDQGFYLSSLPTETNKCLKCNSNCLSCSSEQVCDSCKSSLYLYRTGSTATCIQCSRNCLTCSSSSMCLTCNSLYYLYSDPSSTTANCIQCSSNCKTCSSSSICLTCYSPYYLYKDPSNSFATCIQCSDNCKSCSSTSMCLECNYPYYLYKDPYRTKATCIQCDKDCQSCSSTTICLSCTSTSLYLYNNNRSNTSTCIQCSSNCSSCSSSIFCLSCNPPFYLYNDPSGVTSSCIQCSEYCATCSSTINCLSCTSPSLYLYKIGASATCIQCSSNCQKCSSPSLCITCNSPYYLYKDPSGLTSSCIQCSPNCLTCSSINQCLSCKSQYYLDTDASNNTISCRACGQNCKQCTSPSICTTCNPSYRLQLDKQNNIATCMQCSDNCNTCLSPTQCIECNSTDYYLYQNTLNNSRTCIKCSENCSTCSSSTKCLTCTSPLYYLYQDPSGINDICVQCSQNCQQCSSPTNCLVCDSPFYLFKDTKNNTATCIKCSENCQSCSSTSTCLSCTSPTYYLYHDPLNKTVSCIQCSENCQACSSNTVCLSCNSGYFLNAIQSSTICSLCDPQCNQCSQGSNKNCINCASGYTHADDTSCQFCQNSSVSEQIISVLTKRCSKSSTQCVLNINSSKYENTLICSECKYEYSLYNNSCLTSCSELGSHFVYDQNTNSCICSQLYPYQLSTMQNQQICSDSILAGYYCDSNKTCKQCIENCSTCSDQINCTLCFTNNYIWLNKCVDSCPDSLNMKIDQTNTLCECQDNYYYREQSKKCVLILKVDQVLFYTNEVYNILVVQLNRAPFAEELTNLGLVIDPNSLIKGIDYNIVSQEQKNDQIIYQISVPINIKFSQIFFSINSSTRTINVVSTTLLTQSYLKKESTKSTTNTMDNASQQLISGDGFLLKMTSFLKSFQILGSFSNFIQIYGALVIFYGKEPLAVFIGQLLGSSFIFKDIPSYKVIMEDQTLDHGDADQYVFLKLGLSSQMYNDYVILPHIFIQAAVLINIFCFIARWRSSGKQYSITIVNILLNLLYSLQQGFITLSLFSIFFCLRFGENKGLAVYQLLIHVIFFVQMTLYFLKRESGYIEINLPNMIQNIKPLSRGWKSYFVLSYLKKYICIIIILTLNNPLVITITLSVIFLIFAAYLAYYRFFTHTIFNLIKPTQEIIIGISFITLSVCIQMNNKILSSLRVSDDELLEINKVSFGVIILFTICMLVSTLIYLIRLLLSIQTIYKQIKQFIEKRNQRKQIFLQNITLESRIDTNFDNSKFTNLFLKYERSDRLTTIGNKPKHLQSEQDEL